jgi:hypothetical protein
MGYDRKPKLFILAGSITEYNHYYRLCEENFDTLYVRDEQSIRGYRGEYYICLGNWHRKRDVHYLISILKASGFRELYSSDISSSFLEDHQQDIKRRREYEEAMEKYGNGEIEKIIYEFLTEEEMQL